MSTLTTLTAVISYKKKESVYLKFGISVQEPIALKYYVAVITSFSYSFKCKLKVITSERKLNLDTIHMGRYLELS